MRSKVLVIAAFVFVLFLPILVQRLSGRAHSQPADAGAAPAAKARTLVIVTPHVEQIREEFAAAFSRWHQRKFNEPVTIDWRIPGGTSDIIKAFDAQFTAAASAGRIGPDGLAAPGAVGYDLFFGGGSYEHSKMRERHVFTAPGEGGGADGKPRTIEYRWGRPAGFDSDWLQQVYGENKIGIQNLYDPEQYWLGAALSGFGIVYNRTIVRELGLPFPESFADLCDPRYAGLLSLADARQSGSITTTYDSILNKEDWDRGWRILREMSGNARLFASASTKPPVDVSQGDAAAGLAIDFYGRGQGQYVLAPGQSPDDGRVGYVDPRGATYIDADPVSIVNGANDFELARRFVEFVLTDEAQALWQFPSARDPLSASNPVGEDGRKMGPAVYELRRMPVRRVMYQKYREHFIDRTNPFESAADVPTRGYRPAIAPLMAAFGIDTSDDCRAAWKALNRARQGAAAGTFNPDTLTEMERLFYAMPEHQLLPRSIWWPADLTTDLSKDAIRELEKRRVTTFDALDKQLADAASTSKLAPAVLDDWRRLAARAAQAPAQPQTVTLSQETFRAVRNDTDSWKDPEHGKRSLIAYTEFFRDAYRRVVDLERRGRRQ